jgi:hypothetical protein
MNSKKSIVMATKLEAVQRGQPDVVGEGEKKYYASP